MVALLKTIIWIAGSIVVATFVLSYFGYEINMKYFSQSKAKCQEEVKKCGEDVLKEGTNNVKCDFNCVNINKLIIKKK